MTAAARRPFLSSPAKSRLLVLPMFVMTSFLSAALLFSIQPMFTKLVLPVLGGSASVWSIAMVFFQTTLLLGYTYAHILARFCSPRLSLLIHAGMAVLAILSLPIAIPSDWGALPERFQSFWLIGLFTVAVGLPFFWLSSNGPLLQAWFSKSDQSGAEQPYFLYAASNIGSFAALLAYPLLIEPLIPLGVQTHGWAIGFFILFSFVVFCGFGIHRPASYPSSSEAVASAGAAGRDVAWKDRFVWIALAFVPSGLLVSVTAHISTDIAAVPLLWVVPLALFLLTFVLTFTERGEATIAVFSRVQVWSIAMAFIGIVLPQQLWLSIAVHLTAFFASAMICHTALYRHRPAAKDLTEFYLFMSLGGCLGGIFAAIIAPQVFSSVLEYPILLVLALFCRPHFFREQSRLSLRKAGRNFVLCGVLVAAGTLLATDFLPAGTTRLMLVVIFGLLLMANWRSPQWIAPTAIAAALCATVVSFGPQRTETIRSFFGVHKLTMTEDERFLTLSHGTTVHGAVRLHNDDGTVPAGRPVPTTYYAYEGGIGTGIASVREAKGGILSSVAAIGLGSGSLACHSAAGENWTFFEIDAEVLKIARDPSYFPFLAECAPEASVVLGDARLTIGTGQQRHDLMVVDAFSSDAIPAHLLTREAFALYRDRIQPDGAILIHISNRHLDLTQIVARVAAEVGLVAYKIDDSPEEDFSKNFRSPTIVMALAPSKADLGRIAGDGAWQLVPPDLSRRPWTDDFSNVAEAILDKHGW